MPTGKVKFFNAKNKFGFITEQENGREYYVHIKDLIDPVMEGDEVIFDVEERKRGPVAVLVRKKAGLVE